MYKKKIIDKAKKIKMVVCDVDGVLTSGNLFYTNKGYEMLAFHIHDGVGIKLLQNSGVIFAIITGSNSPIISERMKILDIKHIYQGDFIKLPIFEELLKITNLKPEEVACIGDDLPELPLLQNCGLAIAVSNAVPTIKRAADIITIKEGGNGAVREICDLIMQAQDSAQMALNKLLKNQ